MDTKLNPPFFSVLLPTKNRSEILPGAIRSVLAQTFGDFELIVSDNDDSPEKTRDAVATFSDPRIRYVRTPGNLAMHQNWDNAFLHATGRFVLVLEDKMRFVPNALEVLARHLEGSTFPVSYALTSIKDESLAGPTTPPPSREMVSRAIIDDFVCFRPAAFDKVPKGLDCCVSRELLAKIKAESPTGYLYSYICPDYAFGFMVLSRMDRIIRIDEPLVYIPNNWLWSGNYSNGQATYRKNELIRRFVRDLPIKPGDIVAHVPIKAEFLWINMVLHDFFKMYRRPDHQPEVNWADYHAFVMTLILLGRKLGADMTEEIVATRASLRQSSFSFQLSVAFKLVHHLFLAGTRALRGRLATRRNQSPKS